MYPTDPESDNEGSFVVTAWSRVNSPFFVLYQCIGKFLELKHGCVV